MFADPLTERLAAFVHGVGVEVRPAALAADTFLPGLLIHDGAILVDEDRLAHPGDLLHEAGHLAVTDPAGRGAPTLDPTPAEEMAAIAWSYAALVHLALPPRVVFHPGGYKGGSEALIEAFTRTSAFGTPMLLWCGMTLDPKAAAQRGLEPYPHMLRWLR